MKRSFVITTKIDHDFSAAVFSVGIHSPLESLKAVESDLHKRKVKGRVVFDLLLTNGTKKNRYYMGFFDGDKFSSGKFENVDECSQELKQLSATIYSKNADKLDGTLLSKAMQFALKTGIPF